MARPTKYTKARAATICGAIKAGNTRKVAAALAGVGESTVFDWLARFQSFRSAMQKAEAEAESHHVDRIVQAANDGTWQASAWWLERRRRDDWGRRVTLDLSEEIREMVATAGLGDDVEAEALAEAQDILKRARRG